jgi:transcriptional regulator with XRE-family HTH domain
MITMDIGITLRKLRNMHKYSQQHVADCLEISREAYKRWENNRVNFSISQLYKVADLYAMEIHQIIEMSYLHKKTPTKKGSQLLETLLICFVNLTIYV